MLIGGYGLTMGPLLAASAMHFAGPSGIFWLLAVVHGCIGAYGLYRMSRREPVPLDAQRSYDPVSFRTSPIVQAQAGGEADDPQEADIER